MQRSSRLIEGSSRLIEGSSRLIRSIVKGSSRLVKARWIDRGAATSNAASWRHCLPEHDDWILRLCTSGLNCTPPAERHRAQPPSAAHEISENLDGARPRTQLVCHKSSRDWIAKTGKSAGSASSGSTPRKHRHLSVAGQRPSQRVGKRICPMATARRTWVTNGVVASATDAWPPLLAKKSPESDATCKGGEGQDLTEREHAPRAREHAPCARARAHVTDVRAAFCACIGACTP